MSIKTTFNKVKFAGKRYSPELCLIGATVSGLGALYFAYRAGKKTDDIIYIHTVRMNNCEDECQVDMSPKEYKKARAIETLKTVKDFGIAFAPAIACTSASIFLTFTGFGIQRKRIAGLAAAFNSVNLAYNGLVNAIETKYGLDTAEDLIFNRTKEKREVTIENEDGTYTTKPQNIKTYSAQNNAPFTYVFSKDTSRYYKDDPNYNTIFLNNAQRSINDQFYMRGFMHMNNALEQLGLELDDAGFELGWVFDPNDEECQNYISLGFTTMNGDTDFTRFMSGEENAILIHLKPDGYINHLFKEYSNI